MGFRSLGGTGSPLQVSGPISFTTPLSSVPLPLPSYSPTSVRGLALAAVVEALQVKEAIELCTSFPGLLQLSLCDSQGHRWVAPGDRPLTPQQLGGCLPFPHGDYPVCSPISPSQRLDGIPGSPGCIPPCSGPSVFTTLPEVLRVRVGLPVPHPLLRPVDGCAGVYISHGPDLFDNASSRFPDSRVPR